MIARANSYVDNIMREYCCSKKFNVMYFCSSVVWWDGGRVGGCVGSGGMLDIHNDLLKSMIQTQL